MEIKASCVYDYKVTKALARLGVFKRKNPRKQMIFFAIVYAVWLVITIVSLVFLGADTFILILMAVGLFIGLWYAYLYFLLPKKCYKGMGKMRDAKNEFVFYEDRISVSTVVCDEQKNIGYSGESQIEYSLLKSVYETSEYIFLYISRGQAFVVDKSTLTPSGLGCVKNVLSGILSNRYFVCNY